MTSHLPFSAIAAAALSQSVGLVAEWLPDGRMEGPEFKALNPTRADGKIGSFSVNLVTGAWGDFATGDTGGDLVSLYAYLFHGGDQGKAAVDLAGRFNIALLPLEKGRKTATKPGAPKPAPAVSDKPPRTWWSPIRPIPDDAPAPPKANPNRGIPARISTYREVDGRVIGYVCRFITLDGGKDDIPLVFAKHAKSGKCEWRWMAFAEDRRPLYGLDRAAALPDATLLFTEGEKCADVAHQALPDLASVSWPGGCNGVGKADIEALAGRAVKKALLWPDCDAKREPLTRAEKAAGVDPQSKPLLPVEKQPGTKAMLAIAARLYAVGFKVWMIEIPKPGEKSDGWDIADAVAAGLTPVTLAEFLRENARPWHPPGPPAATAEPLSTPPDASAGKWETRLVYKRGELAICTANVADIILNRPEWRGVLGYDDFEKKTVKLKPPPFYGGEIGDWEDSDDTWTSMWMARTYGFTPASTVVAEAVEAIAKKVFQFNPVRDYLNSLVWDGVPRLDDWLTDYLDVEKSEYSVLVGRYFFIAMIDRAMNPGGQFKYCLVLEGLQDAGKSKALRIIGGPWYGDTDIDLHNKDSMVGIQGKWLYEFPEMDSISRSEASRTKSFLSSQVDEFRPHYGRRIIKCRRQTVFAGSVNEYEYLKDPSGAVRFWSVLCGDDINHEALVGVRDQLFAEAMIRWRNKERFYPTREQQTTLFSPQQIKREQQDSLIDVIHDWVYARLVNFSAADVMMECLKLDASKMTRDVQTRIGIALRKLGCKRIERRNGMIRYWYEPPARNGAGSTSGMSAPTQQVWEGDDVPL